MRLVQINIFVIEMSVLKLTKTLLTAVFCQLPILVSASIDIWFGLAPFCPRNETSVCTLYDLLYIKSDTIGSGYRCLKGVKVLCRTKDLRIPIAVYSNELFSVVAYNVMESALSAGRNGQMERTCRIPRALLLEIPFPTGVVIFTELYTHGCLAVDEADRRLTIADLMSLYGYPHIVTMGEDRRTVYEKNGGIMIASQWPLFNVRELNFRNKGQLGHSIQRGAIYAMVVINETEEIVRHIVGINLHSGDENPEIRVQQATELYDFITELDIPNTEYVFIAGGFNCDKMTSPSHCSEVFNRMGVIEAYIAFGPTITVDPSTNKMVDKEHTVPELLDYVAYSKRHKTPAYGFSTVLTVKANKDFSFCISASSQPFQVAATDTECNAIKTTQDLSDHYPILGYFAL